MCDIAFIQNVPIDSIDSMYEERTRQYQVIQSALECYPSSCSHASGFVYYCNSREAFR